MTAALDLLRQEVSAVTKQLSQPLSSEQKAQLIQAKEDLANVIYLLTLCQDLGLTRKSMASAHRLPLTATDSSEYRLMDDCDTEDRNWWQELPGHRLQTDDVIIIKKT